MEIKPDVALVITLAVVFTLAMFMLLASLTG